MVAGKPNSTVGQLCFRRNFQTVRNMQKGSTEMSSEGPKMVERRYGLARNVLKWPKNQERSGDPRWPPPPLRRPDPGAFGSGWSGNFIGVIVWRWRTSLSGACCRLMAGDAPLVQNSTARKWVKKTQLGVHDFGEFFLGFWSSRWCFGG